MLKIQTVKYQSDNSAVFLYEVSEWFLGCEEFNEIIQFDFSVRSLDMLRVSSHYWCKYNEN